VKLAYRDLAAASGAAASGAAASGVAASGAVPAVVLHREAETDFDRPVEVARAGGAMGRVVVPFGHYAFYPSGMEAGGICWYRVMPGYAGTDPISLATAVVQVCDLIDDLALERPLLVGWGQGAVVALGAGLLRAGALGAMACVDLHGPHVELLPDAVWGADGASALPLLVAATRGDDQDDDPAAAVHQQLKALAARGITASTWSPTPADPDGPAGRPADPARRLAEADRALGEALGVWSADLPRWKERP
jgi:hypothetical protein